MKEKSQKFRRNQKGSEGTGSKLREFQGIWVNLNESRLTWKNPRKSEGTCSKEPERIKENLRECQRI